MVLGEPLQKRTPLLNYLLVSYRLKDLFDLVPELHLVFTSRELESILDNKIAIGVDDQVYI